MTHPTPSPTADDGPAGDGTRGQKRPSWDDDSSANDHSSKRRASRACLSCRNRKERCDVVKGGIPCTNCRLDRLDCVVTESNRGRRPNAANSITVAASRATANSAVPPPPPAPAANTTPPALGTTAASASPPSPPHCHCSHSRQPSSQHRDRPEPQPDILSPPQSQTENYLVSLSFEDQSDHSHHQFDETHQSEQPQSAEAWQALPTVNGVDRQLVASAPAHLPSFIRPFPPHIVARDIEYLTDKDALTIPDRDLRDELLRTYAEIVHPFMPALDLHEFLGCILEPRPNSISLLLFQAVMFASVAFVDEECLRARGFSSRKAARKVFFARVRLLYGLDCEQDRLALIQSLLMMTYWYDRPEDEKDTWYWMGIAFSLAQVASLHRDPKHLPISEREKWLRRRIWWSCVMRDRLLALGIRRPARIRDHDFDVSELTVDDFDLSPASDALLGLLGESKLTCADPAARTAMAAACVDLTKLCVCLGHILHSQYSVLGPHAVGSEYFFKVIVMPKRSERQAQDLHKCDAELAEWFHERDARSRYAPGTTPTDDKAERIIRLHRSQLQMKYLTTMCVLHRPQVFCSAPGPEFGVTRASSREKLTEAAVAMTKLAFEMELSDQLRYLSTSSIPAFLSAALVHVLEVRSPDEEVRNISIGRFYQCFHVLSELQEMYASADYAVRFLEMVLDRMNTKIPMLRLNSGSTSRQGSQSCKSSATLVGGPSSKHRAGRTSSSAEPLNALCADQTESLTPFLGSFDTWPVIADGLLMANNSQPELGTVSKPLFASAWADVDSLLPVLIDNASSSG
ncbi:hypothetical protein CNYM01_06101 [Colletotrichum nymphaeae SA-01]|uniref:Zn(2)-C6 fungal-type domain-containing protein n=1 Tax=Colletotrichum nymphaeae SA-01 TaxID=1460502 RepID=A0A135UFU6_9PEZI|nr:hypothetical protein CNYM01_06101 [Colletotrichum nymphaeae SA-01]